MSKAINCFPRRYFVFACTEGNRILFNINKYWNEMLLTLIYRSTNAKVVCIKFHSIYRCTSGNPEWKSGYNSIMLYITHINTIPRICKCIRTRTLEDYVQLKHRCRGLSVCMCVTDVARTYLENSPMQPVPTVHVYNTNVTTFPSRARLHSVARYRSLHTQCVCFPNEMLCLAIRRSLTRRLLLLLLLLLESISVLNVRCNCLQWHLDFCCYVSVKCTKGDIIIHTL